MREIAELFLREATARPNCPEALVAHRISGSTCFYFGDFAGADENVGVPLAVGGDHRCATNQHGLSVAVESANP